MTAKPIEQLSGDWKKDIGTWGYEKQDVRTKFVTKAALLSLRVKNEAQVQEALHKPKDHDLVSLGEMQGKNYQIDAIPRGLTLSTVLQEYYKDTLGVKGSAALRKNINATLYYLDLIGKQNKYKDATGHNLNVDYLKEGWELSINDGKLTIWDPIKEEYFLQDVPLRPDDTFVGPPAPPPVAPPSPPPVAPPSPPVAPPPRPSGPPKVGPEKPKEQRPDFPLEEYVPAPRSWFSRLNV